MIVTPPSVSKVSTPPTRLSRIAFAVVCTLASFSLVAKYEYTVTAAAVAVIPKEREDNEQPDPICVNLLSASIAEIWPCVRGMLKIKRTDQDAWPRSPNRRIWPSIVGRKAEPPAEI